MKRTADFLGSRFLLRSNRMLILSLRRAMKRLFWSMSDMYFEICSRYLKSMFDISVLSSLFFSRIALFCPVSFASFLEYSRVMRSSTSFCSFRDWRVKFEGNAQCLMLPLWAAGFALALLCSLRLIRIVAPFALRVARRGGMTHRSGSI